ncbi:MAG TPA: glycosyltransferase family 4 protein, partial [Candidatus Acidoferrales bacterium]|nr:glycosyltransferase family 4 protein [Candidatus Acidoferrales bacterium]
IDSNIKLTIVSSGKYDKNIKELIVHHRLKKNIKLFFNIPHYDINKYYRQSSIVVVPSLWPEPLGMVGLEAMRNGIPVIATKVGGIPEWLNDGKTGFLIEPKNQKQIAEKVIILFKDKELMNRMSIEAKNKVKKFSIEKQVERLEEVYISTIEKYIN